jgi:3-hydroxyisobutyrate dehydrogenase-like beta-hydroxyacid dehydrogenase
MGYAMAANIRKKISSESTLYINDINAAACEHFKAEYSSFGCIEIVATAREAAENAKVLISIVPGGQDVQAVYLDEKNGVIAAKKNEERLMLECSTIDVATTKEVGRRFKKAGLGTYIDAPVSVRLPSIPNCTPLLTRYLGWRPSRRIRHPLHAHRAPSTVRILVLQSPLKHTLPPRYALKILLP